MEVLVLTPRDNNSSRRSASWAEQLAERFPGVLEPRKATSRPEAEKLLATHRHVLYFGHGEIDALVVPRRHFRARKVLVDEGNLTNTPGRIVIAVACWSGEGLARAATAGVPQPVTSYIGWRDEVSWPAGWPNPIGDAVVEGLSVLFEGGTVDDCATAIATAFDRAHARYRAEGPSRLTADHVMFGKMCAEYWKGRMVVEGDRAATL